MDVLSSTRPFSSLSIGDLLAARDLYHWHLIAKRNVVGTAIGRYLIRREPATGEQHRAGTRERTFDNSEVRDYSWPCVLVLVERWVDAGRFGVPGSELSAEDFVPSVLYLPDGRTVPVCVVRVAPTVPDDATLPPRTWPAGRLGGGFPLLVEVQGQQHLASAGALVTDGHTTYVLTSRHVTGPAGSVVASTLRGVDVGIGRSAGPHLTRLPFSTVYPEFPAQRRTFLTLDAGLVELDDVTEWTSRSYGLPPVGQLADLNELNLGLPLIGARVRAFGAASGNLTGRIAALFYRYRSVGGYDDVTDFLIAPEHKSDGATWTRPGDSGTVWHLVTGETAGAALRPIALEWGGQGLLGAAGRRYNVTLAANLTSVLRLLSVDLVTGHNVGAQPFWGKTGHYTIASYACAAVDPPNLRALLAANLDRISFPLDDLGHHQLDQTTVAQKKAGAFLPLADVADLIWKNLPSAVPGGRDTAPRTGPEHPCHYADIDEPDPDGTTLRQLSLQDPANVDVAVWQRFYSRLGHVEPDSRGLLPFRVWQFYDAMAQALAGRDLDSFVAAAGLAAHYVGDACQPLHGSIFSNGLPDGTGAGVHSVFENSMIDRHDTLIAAGLPDAVARTEQPEPPASGKEAAIAVIRLMERTATLVPPKAVVEAYVAGQAKPGDSSPAVTTALWNQFGQPTIAILADGVRTLAALWTGAWSAAGGEQAFPPATLTPRDVTALQRLYQSPDFVPSLDLDHVGPLLRA